MKSGVVGDFPPPHSSALTLQRNVCILKAADVKVLLLGLLFPFSWQFPALWHGCTRSEIHVKIPMEDGLDEIPSASSSWG